MEILVLIFLLPMVLSLAALVVIGWLIFWLLAGVCAVLILPFALLARLLDRWGFPPLHWRYPPAMPSDPVKRGAFYIPALHKGR